MTRLGCTGNAQLGTGLGSFWVAIQEDPKRLYHGPEIAASVQCTGVRDAQSGIRIESGWRQAFRVHAVRHAHNGHVGIPRRERLRKLVRVCNDPVGGSEGEAFQGSGESAEGPGPQFRVRFPDLREWARPWIAQVDPPTRRAPDRGQRRHEVG